MSKVRVFVEATVYAIIQTGGKQYRVSPGDVLRVERLPGERGDEGRRRRRPGRPAPGVQRHRPHPDCSARQRQKDPDLQKETPEKLSPQAGPPAALYRLASC